MKLTAIFESWHIGDGNYPPLHKDQNVKLSFEFEPRTMRKAAPSAAEEFADLGNAEYRVCGQVLNVYPNDREEILIIRSHGFRFYIISYNPDQYRRGDIIAVEGALLLDHYIWVEFLDEYKDAPDLFYNLKVKRIRKVQISDPFVIRHKGKALPAGLAPANSGPADVEEIETMEGQPFDEEFYIIDFDGQGLETEIISRTFLG